MKLLLASQSPRRKELLEKLGYEFEVIKFSCDESFPSDLHSAEVAGYISEKKANFYQDLKEDEVLITSDTVVVFNNEILGKPKDREEAFQMLQKLSGNTHEVFSGITIKSNKKTITKTDKALVTFADISEDEINYYINTGSPFDKAGGYGVQDWLGMAKISKIEGSYYTIMGLPTHLVYDELVQITSLLS